VLAHGSKHVVLDASQPGTEQWHIESQLLHTQLASPRWQLDVTHSDGCVSSCVCHDGGACWCYLLLLLLLSLGPLLPGLWHQPGRHHLCTHAWEGSCQPVLLQGTQHSPGGIYYTLVCDVTSHLAQHYFLVIGHVLDRLDLGW